METPAQLLVGFSRWSINTACGLSRFILIVFVFGSGLPFTPLATAHSATDRVQLQLNTDEADMVLAILARKTDGLTTAESDWQRLFATEPYIRLKKREASLKRDFTDDDFKTFVLSPGLAAKADALRHTLADWKKADLTASAVRVLAYLPEQAKIHAKVFPVIKPGTNSFVFETQSDPTIFLYLDPQESAAKFENTVAHELHHIGFSSVDSLAEAKLKDLPPNVKSAVDWMGAFGEGLAMLAAAGGPDVHPHAVSSPDERARWDRDMANFNDDLATVQQFFLDIINRKLSTKSEIDEKAYSFFGVQGPWYTVGYKMAVIVEKRYGRAALIDCMIDPRELLARYNSAATELNHIQKDQLALWSPELLTKIAVSP
ncbi:MAG: DUF5700 domain-containing putative Zn-dependent protease [Bryobacteraceae bacterium]